MFSKNQIAFMKSIGIPIDFSKRLTTVDYEVIEERVAEYLQKNGIDKDYLPSKEGKLCEEILDML